MLWRGDIGETGLFQVVLELWRQRAHGTLVCRSEDRVRGLRFRDGSIVEASSNLAAEALGQFLRHRAMPRAGADTLDQDELALHRRIALELVCTGLVPRTDWLDAQARQARAILDEVLACTDGDFWFQAEPAVAEAQSEWSVDPREAALQALTSALGPDEPHAQPVARRAKPRRRQAAA